MTKKIIALFACMLLALGIVGCSGGSSSSGSEENYIDSTCMGVIASGWEARAALNDKITAETMLDDAKYGAALQEAIDAERNIVGDLKNQKFKDSKLQEKVLSYLNNLDEQYELAGDMDSTDLDFYTKWDTKYNERCSILKDFYDNYDLKVDDKYADDFKEVLTNGKSAQAKTAQKEAIDALVSAATWDVADDGYGTTFTAIIENTSDYSFEDVGIIVSCYDADDVKVEEAYASVNSWAKGEKAKFEAYSGETGITRYEAAADYYTVVDE